MAECCRGFIELVGALLLAQLRGMEINCWQSGTVRTTTTSTLVYTPTRGSTPICKAFSNDQRVKKLPYLMRQMRTRHNACVLYMYRGWVIDQGLNESKNTSPPKRRPDDRPVVVDGG